MGFPFRVVYERDDEVDEDQVLADDMEDALMQAGTSGFVLNELQGRVEGDVTIRIQRAD